MEKKQLLRNPETEPTAEVLAEALEESNAAYTKFVAELESYDIELNWRYYNDGKAWLGKGLHKWNTSRGTAKEATVFWLSIWEGFFKVSIFIAEKARAEALALPLKKETIEKMENAKQMGKLKFFPLIFDLHSAEEFEELFILINFKKTLK